MSAFLTDPSHIALLSIVAAKYGLGDPEEVAGLLTQANLDNLTYLYAPHLHQGTEKETDAAQDSTGGQYTNAQYIAKVQGLARMGLMAQVALNIPLERILGMIDCLEYQCCDTRQFKGSQAERLLTQVRDEITLRNPHIKPVGWELSLEELERN